MGHPITKLNRTIPTPNKNLGDGEVMKASNVACFSIALLT